MKPLLLIILDGWGVSQEPATDALEQANIPFYKNLLKEYPNTVIECSGGAVGLPDGQMGNSEVGHLNLGAGRIVYQDYAKINKSIKDGSFSENIILINAMKKAVDKDGALDLLGLVSDGGVHSHIKHLYALIDLAVDSGVSRIFVHAFMDGRDTPPSSGIDYIKSLEAYIADKPAAKIATVSGRYWAMDRDNRWDRLEHSYKALVLGEGKTAASGVEAVEQSYSRDETDEFIKPTVVCSDAGPVGRIQDNDSVIFFNFRADRARELTVTLTDKNFNGFQRKSIPDLSSYVTMTLYEEDFPFPVAFPSDKLTHILGEILSGNKLQQLRIAETEKYAHVTYFFNGGEETSFEGEDRCLIPSPKDVATYDLKPEMSAYTVTDEILKRLDENKYDFILLNFANPDMVGHTGIMEAAVKACETIDVCLNKIVEKVQAIDGLVMITADHGNCEKMSDGNESFTAHTINPVPFILLKKGATLRGNGILADLPPPVLDTMGIEKPDEMTGESLIIK